MFSVVHTKNKISSNWSDHDVFCIHHSGGLAVTLADTSKLFLLLFCEFLDKKNSIKL